MNIPSFQEENSEYRSLNGITAELIGFMRSRSDEIFDYRISPKQYEESVESEANGLYLAGLLNDLDDSRENFGTTAWRGRALERDENTELRLIIEYDSSDDKSRLPPRSEFVDEFADYDPHDILTEPLEVSIEGELEIKYSDGVI